MAYKFNPLLGVGLDEVRAGGGAATPGGADTQVQFNDGGALVVTLVSSTIKQLTSSLLAVTLT